jgi:hypothetical protein
VEVSEAVEEPVEVSVFVDVVEGVGVAVRVEVLVGLGVIDGVGEILGVLLSLGHVAPTQHTLPDKDPPLLHSQETQHAPGSHPIYSARRRVFGTEHVPQYTHDADFSQRSLIVVYVYPDGHPHGVLVGVGVAVLEGVVDNDNVLVPLDVLEAVEVVEGVGVAVVVLVEVLVLVPVDVSELVDVVEGLGEADTVFVDVEEGHAGIIFG